jgi:CBS domain-containing protein
MMTVKQLLPATLQVWAVTPDTPVAEAAALMDAQGTRVCWSSMAAPCVGW